MPGVGGGDQAQLQGVAVDHEGHGPLRQPARPDAAVTVDGAGERPSTSRSARPHHDVALLGREVGGRRALA